jgi:hypothetical protein
MGNLVHPPALRWTQMNHAEISILQILGNNCIQIGSESGDWSTEVALVQIPGQFNLPFSIAAMLPDFELSSQLFLYYDFL